MRHALLSVVTVASLAGLVSAQPIFFANQGGVDNFLARSESLISPTGQTPFFLQFEDEIGAGIPFDGSYSFLQSGLGANADGSVEITGRYTNEIAIDGQSFEARYVGRFFASFPSVESFRATGGTAASGNGDFFLTEDTLVRVEAFGVGNGRYQAFLERDVVGGDDVEILNVETNNGLSFDQVILLEAGVYSFSFQGAAANNDPGLFFNGSVDIAQESVLRLTIVPAPGTGVALASAGLLMARRRRAR